MPRFIAFLRAIIVGGRNVTMNKLRQLFSSRRFQECEMFIAKRKRVIRLALARRESG